MDRLGVAEGCDLELEFGEMAQTAVDFWCGPVGVAAFHPAVPGGDSGVPHEEYSAGSIQEV